jgi:threonine/homoserine/homoserine lactone efflux protein
MTDYPVTFDVVARPEKFQRPQVLIAILVAIVLGVVMWFAYVVFPIMAAIWISQKGSEKYLDEDGPKMTGWLRSIVAYYCYVFFLISRLPSEGVEEQVKFEVQRGGSPSVGSALLRLIYSIPSGIVLGVLGFVAEILWLVAAVQVLIQENYSEGIYNYFRGYMRWQARLLGYHVSLVDQYPPFALDMEPGGSAPAA